MGQEHSSNKDSHSSLVALARGIGPRANRTVNTGQVVIVNTGLDEKNCMQDDEDFKRLQNIPIFYPILRNSLNIPGVKDEVDINTKFDHRAIYAFFSKFQEQLSQSTEFICSEQLNIVSKIRETDHTVSTLLNCLVERQKLTARLLADLNKTREINNQLIKITACLQEIVPMAQALNELLPETERLPPLDLSVTIRNQSIVFDDIEQKVVDECPNSEN
uniref:BLOC-1-related complex subunit 5 n=1 Tax=Romanomermis culicivorax TaxID=13658 RepID=A0A915IE12_ROMCU